MMVGRLNFERKIFSLLKTRTEKKRTILVGLNSSNYSREMLLRLLNVVVKPGDNVTAIHVVEHFDTFDPNTFHIHEDLCKSKQVDFLIKVCIGNSFVSELCREVRINYATILAIGCSLSRPKESVITSCIKGLPPTCSLLVIDNLGRMILERQGTSQQGSLHVLIESSSSSGQSYFQNHSTVEPQKSPTASPLTRPTIMQQSDHSTGTYSHKRGVEVPDMEKRLFHKLMLIKSEGFIRFFTLQELKSATDNFSPEMVIGEGGNGKVYRAKLEDGRAAAVKVLKAKNSLPEDIIQEVEILSGIRHNNIVQIIGYCDSREMQAFVYNLLEGSLRQNLRQLKWRERMQVAIGVAKALDYLHHSLNPPIIHRDVKSSNILLSDNYEPQLSDFGAAIVYNESEKIAAKVKPFYVVGTFGFLAPEYIMYGKVDEKTDVYSYGVVLLELITGREATQTNQAKQESLVLWARSMMSSGRSECLIDPHLNEQYVEEEMEAMMFAARLCLMHSSSRRPTIKMILKLLEESGCWLKIQKVRDGTFL